MAARRECFLPGYFFFQLPSNLVLEKFGVRRWISGLMVTWGVISCLMIFIRGPVSFYGMRFLLGAAEAGFFPGHDPLYEALVPGQRAGASGGLVHDGKSAGGNCRQSDLRSVARDQRQGAFGMAMDVSDGRGAGHSSWSDRVLGAVG